MSTDYDIVCDTCRVQMHAGQRCAINEFSFGYSTGDSEGQEAVAKFAFEHAYHGTIRILLSDVVEERPSDKYRRIEHEDVVVGPDLATLERLNAKAAALGHGPYRRIEHNPEPKNVLALRARVAAGITWDVGKGSNETPPQEPEVRNILRDCASSIESLTKSERDYAETLEAIREALGQEQTHFLAMPGDVNELVEAIEMCSSDGGCRAKTVLERLREQGRR